MSYSARNTGASSQATGSPAQASTAAATASLRAAVSIAEETAGTAAGTAEELARQREVLNRAHGHVNEMEHLADQAQYTLRSMSFWGRVVNWWTGPPCHARADAAVEARAARRATSPSPGHVGHATPSTSAAPHSATECDTALSPDEQALALIANSLDRTAELGKAIGDELDSQRGQLRQVDDELEHASGRLAKNSEWARKKA